MKSVGAESLLDCSLESPAGGIRTQAVLPFFDAELSVKFLLVVLHGERGGVKVTKHLPTGVVSRTLAYPRPPRLTGLRHDLFRGVWHFDPWWLMRGRDDVGETVREAVIATNLAGKKVPDGVIDNFRYDDGLTAVADARIGGRDVPPRRVQPMLGEGPIESVASP